MIRRTMLVAATTALGACAGSKAPAPDTSAGAVPTPAAAVSAADSVKADSTKPATDTTAKRAAAKAPMGDHDVALKPKFSIDEKTGKVTPIKRP